MTREDSGPGTDPITRVDWPVRASVDWSPPGGSCDQLSPESPANNPIRGVCAEAPTMMHSLPEEATGLH